MALVRVWPELHTQRLLREWLYLEPHGHMHLAARAAGIASTAPWCREGCTQGGSGGSPTGYVPGLVYEGPGQYMGPSHDSPGQYNGAQNQ